MCICEYARRLVGFFQSLVSAIGGQARQGNARNAVRVAQGKADLQDCALPRKAPDGTYCALHFALSSPGQRVTDTSCGIFRATGLLCNKANAEGLKSGRPRPQPRHVSTGTQSTAFAVQIEYRSRKMWCDVTRLSRIPELRRKRRLAVSSAHQQITTRGIAGSANAKAGWRRCDSSRVPLPEPSSRDEGIRLLCLHIVVEAVGLSFESSWPHIIITD